ncbi:MAG TPA: hypothetical protein PKG48_04230 [Bacteroidales bacterium]|nr:hypothetical protein [Bacteroidales bacterium]
MKRKENILIITRRLIILSGITLLLMVSFFGLTLWLSQRFMVSWVCFMAGIMGGFVSIQQRLKKIGNEELTLLSESWYQILLIPIYGGIFSLVLYLLFLSGLLEGSLFPVFTTGSAGPGVAAPPLNATTIKDFFSNTYPSTGQDLAKLIFWCFLAGFSERLVPQIITHMGSKAPGVKEEEDH